jgi:Alginate export
VKKTVFIFLVLAVFFSWSFSGWCEERALPDPVPRDHWACREVAELGSRFQAEVTLPEQPNLTRRDVAAALLAILEKVRQKCAAEGPEGLSPEERTRLATLHETLKEELESFDAYKSVRETIEQILAAPEEPPYLFKAGVSGFLRGEGSGNFSYSLSGSGYTPGTGVGRLTYRIMPYLEWNPTEYLEMEIQGQGYGFTGTPRESQYSLYRAYLEISPPETRRVALKLGRQEFVYGSAFILGANSFFNGLTYDAARLRIKPLPEFTLDLLAGYYAVPLNHYFKDSLMGVYLTYPLGEGTGMETYYVRDQGPQFSHSGEHLDIFGARGTARFGSVALEFEPVYETGRLAGAGGTEENINAWGGHVDMVLDAETAGKKSTFVCGYAYGTGSKDAVYGSSLRREFSNATNNTALIGDIGLFHDLSGITTSGGVHASGLQIITMGWGINFQKNLNFTTTGRHFRAGYTPDGMSRNLGIETDFILTWNINDDTALILAYDRFFAGSFFRDATGSTGDIDYGYAMLQFNLFAGEKRAVPAVKSKP